MSTKGINIDLPVLNDVCIGGYAPKQSKSKETGSVLDLFNQMCDDSSDNNVEINHTNSKEENNGNEEVLLERIENVTGKIRRQLENIVIFFTHDIGTTVIIEDKLYEVITTDLEYKQIRNNVLDGKESWFLGSVRVNKSGVLYYNECLFSPEHKEDYTTPAYLKLKIARGCVDTKYDNQKKVAAVLDEYIKKVRDNSYTADAVERNVY